MVYIDWIQPAATTTGEWSYDVLAQWAAAVCRHDNSEWLNVLSRNCASIGVDNDEHHSTTLRWHYYDLDADIQVRILIYLLTQDDWRAICCWVHYSDRIVTVRDTFRNVYCVFYLQFFNCVLCCMCCVRLSYWIKITYLLTYLLQYTAVVISEWAVTDTFWKSGCPAQVPSKGQHASCLSHCSKCARQLHELSVLALLKTWKLASVVQRVNVTYVP